MCWRWAAAVGSSSRCWPGHAVSRVAPEPPCRRPRLAAGFPSRSTGDVVNAPASPSEVTLPEDGPGGSGGSPPAGRAPGGAPARAAASPRIPQRSRRARSSERAAAAGGAAWFPGRAAWFCQTASCSPPPALSSPGPWRERGVGLPPWPAVHRSARGGRQPRYLLL